MKKEDCLFEKIELMHQTLRKKDIERMLFNMYNSICFSTFPYLLYKEINSENAIKRYNSGNCIGFVYFMKLYLKANYNVKSVIIPASVPSIFKVDGTPHMCHCALLIPMSENEFYILDGAFYFLEPMYCSLNHIKERQIHGCNVYTHEITPILYNIERCEKTQYDIDYNQTLPKDSLRVCSYFQKDPNDTWNYFLVELKNPDNNIGHSFLLHKPNPFIMFTRMENGIVKMKYKMYMEDQKIRIKSYPDGNELYNGNTYEPNDVFHSIKHEMRPHFDDFMI